MMSIRNLIYLISFVLVLSLAGSAQGSLISVNFDVDWIPSLDPGDVAGGPGYACANWNNVMPKSGTLAAGTVVDSTGAVVPGMEITWNAGSEWSPYPAIPPATAGDAKLWGYSFIANATQLGEITVTNIPYDEYHVVVYMSSNWWNRGVETTVAESGITYVAMPPT